MRENHFTEGSQLLKSNENHENLSNFLSRETPLDLEKNYILQYHRDNLKKITLPMVLKSSFDKNLLEFLNYPYNMIINCCYFSDYHFYMNC